MGNQKLTDEDQDFILNLAESGKSLSEIKSALETERKITLGSRQTIANVIKKHREEPAPKPTSTITQVREPANKIFHEPVEPSEPTPKLYVSDAFQHRYSNDAIPVSTSTLYERLIAYCKAKAPGNDISRSMVRNATGKRKHWRRIIMDTIDILVEMDVIGPQSGQNRH